MAKLSIYYKPTCEQVYSQEKKKINLLLTGSGLVRMVKNSDLGLAIANATIGSQIFTIWSSPGQ